MRETDDRSYTRAILDFAHDPGAGDWRRVCKIDRQQMFRVGRTRDKMPVAP